MKILLVSSVALKTPPVAYGGLERVVADYARGLTDLGHDITLVAARGSTPIPGVTTIDTTKPWNELTPAEQQMYSKNDGLEREYQGQKWLAHTHNGWREHERISFERYKDLIDGVDVVLDHSWAKWAYGAKKEEIIGTCHSVKSYNVRPPRSYPLLTGVSHGHSRFLSKDLHVPVRAVQNPVDVTNIRFQKDKTERILSLNRIMPQKGIHLFVDLIEKLKIKADIAGDDSQLVGDQAYVQYIKDKCKSSSFSNYFGHVDEATKFNLLRNAKALICLKDHGYEEVFGLSAVEALASGTPVIALKSWGFDDIILDGKNGFLCKDMEEVEKAVQRTSEIDPTVCRESAERFSIETRSKVYEHLIQQVKEGNRW